MQILIEIQNPSKFDFILELLRGLEYVKVFPVKNNGLQAVREIENLPGENENPKPAVDFKEFWGFIQPQMGIEDVDKQLDEMWEN